MSVLWSVLAGIGTVLLFLLKGVGILLLVVLVLGLLLMFCPFCADVQWAEGIFQVKAGALGIIGSLRFTRIDVVLGVRGEDPAEAARSYGRLNAWLYPTLGFLDRFLYLDFEQLRLLPDFGSAEPTVKDHVSFRVTARAYAIVFTLLRVLYAFWREKVLDVFL